MRFSWFIVFTLALPSSGWGQELIPRAYWPAPEGTQVFNIGYLNTTGDIIPDPTLPISGVDSNIDTLAFGYVRYIGLFGRTSNIKLESSYSEGETDVKLSNGTRVARDFQGMGDLAATVTVNLLGAPVLDQQSFAELRRNPRPLLGASFKLVAPTGKYDEQRIVNTGANRWAGKVELSYMSVLHPKWILETEIGYWGFGDNDDFLGVTREQDPIWAVELHLVRRFGPGFWVSLDGNWYRGGRTTVDGVRKDDLQREATAGVTLVYPFAKGHAVKLNYSRGSVINSDENFDIFGISYVRLF